MSALRCLVCLALLVQLAAAKDGMTVSQLNLHAGKGQAAVVHFGTDTEEYTLGSHPDGFFVAHNTQDVFTIDRTGRVVVLSELLTVQQLAATGLSLAGVPQWQLVALEMFQSLAPDQAGWFTGAQARPPTLNCSYLSILTGSTGSDKVPNMDSFSKTWEDLPPHTHLNVKVVSHFVDDWQGEVAYMKINDNVVWTDAHDQRASRGSFNVCGKQFPDSKFTVPIEVTIPHNATNVKIAFGSTLDSTAIAAFGISSMTLSTRQVQVTPPSSPVPPPPATPQPVKFN